MKSINDLKDLYDYRSRKYQNFAYIFKVVDTMSNLEKNTEVYATSIIVAKDRLKSEIGNRFQVLEVG